MKVLTTWLLKSPARFAILRALYYAPYPLYFRQLVARENLGIRSVQLALAQLIREGLIRAKRDDGDGKTYYLLDRHHQLFGLLEEAISLHTKIWLTEKPEVLGLPRRMQRLNSLTSQLIKVRRGVRGTG